MWEFADHLHDRHANLTSPRSAEEVILEVTGQMAIMCGHTQPCDLDARFCRATYCLAVDPPVFDVFFNSDQGYRASYYHGWHLDNARGG